MRNNTGFTLIELMIVVAIVAILAAIAYPSYANYAFRSRRSDGKAWLTQMTFAQERYYTSFNTYTDDVGKLLGTTVSERQYYTGAVTLADDGQAFTATVTPQGIQASDQCGQLSVTNLGDHGFTGTQTNGNCW